MQYSYQLTLSPPNLLFPVLTNAAQWSITTAKSVTKFVNYQWIPLPQTEQQALPSNTNPANNFTAPDNKPVTTVTAIPPVSKHIALNMHGRSSMKINAHKAVVTVQVTISLPIKRICSVLQRTNNFMHFRLKLVWLLESLLDL